MATIAEQLTSLANTKTAIKGAIQAKGVEVTDTDTFASYADKIGQISGGDAPATKFGASIDTFIGNVDENGVLGAVTEQISLVFDGVKNIGNNGCWYMFAYKTNVDSAVFPDLTTISGDYACNNMFSNSYLTSVSFPVLTTISGASACTYMFGYCEKITSVSFPALTTISNNAACSGMFYRCRNITSVSFPALTTISGVNALNGMFGYDSALTSVSFPVLETVSSNLAFSSTFNSCSALTGLSFPALTTISSGAFGEASHQYTFLRCTALTEIHFRADMQATIEAMSGYADKWGAPSTCTIYFSL